MQQASSVVAVREPELAVACVVTSQLPGLQDLATQPEVSERADGMGGMPPILRVTVEFRELVTPLLIRPREDIVQRLAEGQQGGANPLDVIVSHATDIIREKVNAAGSLAPRRVADRVAAVPRLEAV
jgi:hypothetical protein